MIRFVYTVAAVAGGLILAGLALGQTRTTTREVTSTTTTVHKGTVLTGATVVVQGGATVGKVEDFVITDGGCIEYVVVVYDGKYVFVPWGVTTWTRDKTIRVNVTKETFVAVPTFTRDRWPSLTDARYVEQVRTAFGVTENRTGDPNRRPLDRKDDRRDDRTDRKDDRRDQKDQRKDVENPNRPPVNNPPAKSKDGSKDKSKDGSKDRPRDPTDPNEPERPNRPDRAKVPPKDRPPKDGPPK
jgi:hypothetical protein